MLGGTARRRTDGARLITVVALVLGAGAVIVPAAVAADAAPRIALSFASHEQNFIGQGEGLAFSSDAGDITTAVLTPTGVRVAGDSTPSRVHTYDVELRPADGSSFRVGSYGHIEDFAPGTVRNGLADGDVSGPGRGCATRVSFRVVRFATDGDTITDLDLDFTQRCDDSLGWWLYGELRVGHSVTNAGEQVSVGSLQFPTTPVATAAVPFPVVVTNRAQTAFRTAPAVVGRDRQAFEVTDDGCSSVVLQPGDSCTVEVTFRPVQQGVMVARLARADGQGVDLSGYGTAADTSFGVLGSPGDRLSGGRHYRFEPVHSGLGARVGTRAMSVRTFAQGAWFFDLAAPDGERLRVGTFRTRMSAPRSGELAMELAGDGRACSSAEGRVTIRRLAVDPSSGAVHSADLSYRYRCDSASAAVVGDVRYNAPDPLPRGVRADASPATVAYGRTVTMSGHAPPNATVSLAVRVGTASHPRTVTAGTDGVFRATVLATDDVVWSAGVPGTRSATRTVRVAPTVTGAATRHARRGTPVPLAGTGNPRRDLDLVVRVGGREIVRRHVDVHADGRWTTSVRSRPSERVVMITPGSGTRSRTIVITS